MQGRLCFFVASMGDMTAGCFLLPVYGCVCSTVSQVSALTRSAVFSMERFSNMVNVDVTVSDFALAPRSSHSTRAASMHRTEEV